MHCIVFILQYQNVQNISKILLIPLFVRGLLSGGLLSGGFCPGGFCPVPRFKSIFKQTEKLKLCFFKGCWYFGFQNFKGDFFVLGQH
jgi:hypothetical protein